MPMAVHPGIDTDAVILAFLLRNALILFAAIEQRGGLPLSEDFQSGII